MCNSSQAQDPSRRDMLKRIAQGAVATTLPVVGRLSITPAMAHGARNHSGRTGSPAPDPDWKPLFLDEHQNELVEVLTELIIPETDTPGAKAALVNRFIDLTLNEEDPSKQRRFIEGLAWIDARSARLYGKPFLRASVEQQVALLAPLADPGNKNPEELPGVEFFEEFKDLTVLGYYTSKVGMEQELERGGDDYHAEFPGACTHPEHQTEE